MRGGEAEVVRGEGEGGEGVRRGGGEAEVVRGGGGEAKGVRGGGRGALGACVLCITAVCVATSRKNIICTLEWRVMAGYILEGEGPV